MEHTEKEEICSGGAEQVEAAEWREIIEEAYEKHKKDILKRLRRGDYRAKIMLFENWHGGTVWKIEAEGFLPDRAPLFTFYAPAHPFLSYAELDECFKRGLTGIYYYDVPFATQSKRLKYLLWE